MVHYLSESGEGIARYAETDWGTLDYPVEEIPTRIEYEDPGIVDLRAARPNVARMEQGYRLKPETLPKRVLWASKSAPLPDVLPRFAVSARFRDLIETFEPGTHQFVPVDIYRARGGSPAETYYWFIVSKRLDSVDRAHTTFFSRASKNNPDEGHWLDEIMDRQTYEFTPIEGAQLFFSNDATRGHHVWHDPHVLTHNNRLCSDELARAVSEGGFTGVGATPRQSI